MNRKTKVTVAASGIGAILVIAALVYVLTTPDDEAATPVAESPTPTQPQPIQRDDYRKRLDELRDRKPEPAETTEPPTPEPNPDVVQPPPGLENSDSVVQKAAEMLSPELSKWLLPDEQVRKWVLTVDLMADGTLPKRYRPVDYPMEKFSVTKQGDTLLMSESNYARTNRLVDTVTGLDVELLADYYRAWKPLLEEAYGEQGKPGTFAQRLDTVLEQVIAAEPLPKRPVLKQPSVLYRYQDEALENASDVQKLMWRMGEENMRELQAFARKLQDALERN